MSAAAPKPAFLLRPTANTPFHIDFNWWQQNDHSWRIYLLSLLCEEHRQQIEAMPEGQLLDWVDNETGEVHPVDGVQHLLMTHCALQPNFINAHTALVEAIFRTLLANGNRPMTPEELAQRLNRPATTILQTLSGPRAYKGIRPIFPS